MATKKITLEKLFKAGAYLGHKKDKTSSKMSPFIYRVQSGVSIIDLDKTVEKLDEAIVALEKTAKKGETIIFVGTKNQLKEIIAKAAQTCKMPYVTNRWIGGTLTNFKQVRKNVDHLQKLEEDMKAKKYEGLTKKEKKGIEKEIATGNILYGGIKEMRKIPGLMIVFDTYKDNIAVLEAKQVGTEVIGLNDMDIKEKLVDYFVPINDESNKTIKIVAQAFSGIINKAKK